MTTLYRIQDAEGRGPWRPGFSHQWIDPDKDDSLCPPMMVEFPNWRARFTMFEARGFLHFGCCVRGIVGLHRWFTPDELERLRGFGFRLVDASTMHIVCEGKTQIIGASHWPLRWLPRIEWEMAA